jgi:hypothetical protein
LWVEEGMEKRIVATSSDPDASEVLVLVVRIENASGVLFLLVRIEKV